MTAPSTRRRVVVLAPMPLEMHAITTAFGLTRTSSTKGAPWTGTSGIPTSPPSTSAWAHR